MAFAIAGLLGALAMFAMGCARGPTALAGGAFALGLLGEMYRPVSSTMVADVVAPADRARAYGLLYWAVNIGFSMSSVLGGALAAQSFSALFVIDALTTILFVMIVTGFVPESRPAPTGAASDTSGRAPASSPPRTFLLFAAASLVLSAAFHQVATTLPMDMGTHGIGPRSVGLLLLMNGVIVMTLQPFAPRLLGGVPPTRELALASVLIGLGLGVPSLLGPSPGAYALCVVVWTLGEIAMAGVAPSVVADLSPPHLRGSYQGMYELVWGLGAFVGPIAGARLLARFGSAGLGRCCIAAGLLAMAGFVSMRAPKSDCAYRIVQ
jgi:predicted MFS family arabinose efflux permease